MNVSQSHSPDSLAPRIPHPSDEQISRYLNVLNENFYDHHDVRAHPEVRRNAGALYVAAMTWLKLHGIPLEFDEKSQCYKPYIKVEIREVQSRGRQ